MIIETELKLTIDESEIPKLLAHSLLQELCQAPADHYPLYSVYFDTNDFDLLQNGFVLRIREYEDQLIQTVKTANKSESGLHQRKEYNHTVSEFKPDLAYLVSENLLSEKQVETIAAKIKAIFITDMQRTAWVLKINNTAIELALDQGKIISGAKSEIISEVELELIEGDEQELIHVAKLLQQDVLLREEDQSKAERGYRLFKGNLS